jgi:hypothetical protein
MKYQVIVRQACSENAANFQPITDAVNLNEQCEGTLIGQPDQDSSRLTDLFTGATLMAKRKHRASKFHLKAAARHAAAAHHHLEAAHEHDYDNHEEAKKHADSALNRSQDADRHSKSAHVHSQK